MTDKEAFYEFAKGASLPIVVIGLFLLFVVTIGHQESPRFGVVDKYKGCDVVRYTPDNSARYVYFLDCHEN